MDLSAHCTRRPQGRTFVARVTENKVLPEPLREGEVLLLRNTEAADAKGFKGVLRLGGATGALDEIVLPDALSYLAEGDIVRVNEVAGEIRVMYRRCSVHNVLFFTERCNSRCLMCSQPPRDIDDGYLVDDVLEAVPMMDIETRVLCITGGEPTILGSRLIEVIGTVKQYLPSTALHMLSNGRAFSYAANARAIRDVEFNDLMIGIPLYSDVASIHNFVVQAKGAFDQTLRGIVNLGRYGVPVELRFVIHLQTVARMAKTARFIARNLPFVFQVALMGLEMTGYTRSNIGALWIDPWDYRDQLRDAVEELSGAGIRVMIYNLPLCLLHEDLWTYAQKSISDWKNIYLPECAACSLKSECSGFFASATFKYSEHIKPMVLPSLPADGADHLI